MKISVDYLDLLYEEHFNALAKLEEMNKHNDMPDDGYSSHVYKSEMDHALSNKMRTKNRIIAYLEHHP